MVQLDFELRHDTGAWALNHTTFLPAVLVNTKKVERIQCVKSCEEVGAYTFSLEYKLEQVSGGQIGRPYQKFKFASSFNHC